MANKTIMIGLVAIAFVAGSILTGTMAEAKEDNPKKGKVDPLQAVWDAIAGLQAQIDSISLTPGPQGEQGIQGETGLQGIQGEIGSDATSTSTLNLGQINMNGGTTYNLQPTMFTAGTIAEFGTYLPQGILQSGYFDLNEIHVELYIDDVFKDECIIHPGDQECSKTVSESFSKYGDVKVTLHAENIHGVLEGDVTYNYMIITP